MQDRTFCLVLLAAVLTGICHGAPLITDEVLAKKFVDKVSAQLNIYFDELVHDTINMVDNDPEAAIKAFNKILSTAEIVVGIVNETKAFDYSQFKDKELQRIFYTLRKSADEAVVGKEKHVEMLEALIMLDELASDKDIQGYRDETLELAYFPEIQNIFMKSNDSEELKYYWSAWRDKNDLWAKKNFEIMVTTFRDAANLTGEILSYAKWAVVF